MNYNNFGELLKAMRIERKWSLDEACSGVCNRRTYIRWENNESDPTSYYLHMLSNHFNCDLQAFYKLFICNETARAWTYKEKAEKLLQAADWVALYNCILEMEQISEFSSGENKQSICYYYSLYYYIYKKDYQQSIDYCINRLNIEDSSITFEFPIGKIYSNVGLCLLNCLAINFEHKGDINKCILVFKSILDIIDEKIIPDMTFYQSSDFEKKLYQAMCYNISLRYFQEDKLEEALKYAEKGINFSCKYHYMFHLTQILKLKFKILYKQKNYQEARSIYDSYYNLHLLETDQTTNIDEIELLHQDYSEILSIDPYKL